MHAHLLNLLACYAAAASAAAQIGSLPAYAGLTLGGVLATSAHGSGVNELSVSKGRGAAVL